MMEWLGQHDDAEELDEQLAQHTDCSSQDKRCVL